MSPSQVSLHVAALQACHHLKYGHARAVLVKSKFVCVLDELCY